MLARKIGRIRIGIREGSKVSTSPVGKGGKNKEEKGKESSQKETGGSKNVSLSSRVLRKGGRKKVRRFDYFRGKMLGERGKIASL